MANNKELDDLTQEMLAGVQEAFHSGRFQDYLKAMSRFHLYSYRNSILIYTSRHDATLTAGYKTWNSLKRHVKKGEKGIRIFAPYKVKVVVPPKEKDGEPEEKHIIKFRPVFVFDISQTEGEPLPEIAPPLKGDREDFPKVLKAVESITDYSVSFEDIPDPDTFGYCQYSTKKIVLRNGISQAQAMKTLFHELAHSRLHNLSMEKAQKEIEAESISFVVSEHFGLDTSSYSFDYLASWSEGMETKKLCELLEGIQSHAHEMIQQIEQALQQQKLINQEISPEQSEQPDKDQIKGAAPVTNLRIAQEPTKNTIIVNLFAGPGAGKTTCAWEIASELKKRNIQTEYVPEYAKELVWDDNRELLDGSLKNQKKLFQEQNHRLARLIGKVDVVVTDSPILLNQVYLKEPDAAFQKEIMDAFCGYHNFNLFVKRGDYYEQSGRLHTLEESKKKDQEVKALLDSNHIYYGTYFHSTIEKCVDNIVYSMNHNKAFQVPVPQKPKAEPVPPLENADRAAKPLTLAELEKGLKNITFVISDTQKGVNQLKDAGGPHLASLVEEYRNLMEKDPLAFNQEVQEYIVHELENYFNLKEQYGDANLDKLYRDSMNRIEALYSSMDKQELPHGTDPEEYRKVKDFLSDTLIQSDDASTLNLRLQVLLSTSPLFQEEKAHIQETEQGAEPVPPLPAKEPDSKNPILKYCQKKHGGQKAPRKKNHGALKGGSQNELRFQK